MIVPESFPHKGEYRRWTKSWNPDGFSAEPQYPGQQPIRFPLEWSPFQCFLAAKGSGQ